MDWVIVSIWIGWGMLAVAGILIAVVCAIVGWGRWIDWSLNKNLKQYKDASSGSPKSTDSVNR
jgi:hypothetical protein